MLFRSLGVVPGSPVLTPLGPNESILLEASAIVSEDTVNTVSVDGVLANGGECETATDTPIARAMTRSS